MCSSAVGGRRSAVGGRRSAVGGRPVRRGALRLDEIQFQPIFSFNLGTLPNFAPPGEIRHWEVTARVQKAFLSFFSICFDFFELFADLARPF